MAAVKKNRGKVWSNEATKTLLYMWCDETIQVAFDHSNGPKKLVKFIRGYWLVILHIFE